MEGVEHGEPTRRGREQRAVARERLVEVQHVRGALGEVRRRRAPRRQDRGPDEARHRPVIHREVADVDTVEVERRLTAVRMRAADHAHAMAERGEPRRLLPEHPLCPALWPRG